MTPVPHAYRNPVIRTLRSVRDISVGYFFVGVAYVISAAWPRPR